MAEINTIIDQITHWGLTGLWKLVFAVIIWFVGKKVISISLRLLKKIFDKGSLDAGVINFTMSIIKFALYAVLILMVIDELGIQTTSLITVFGSAALAVGMSLQGSLSNFAGGVLILIFKPFKVGDTIEAQGQCGTVKEIQIFNTILTTPDNKIIIIPNGGLSTGLMKNYSKEATRRVDWEFGIAYGDDYTKAKRVIARLLDADGRVLKDPAYFIALTSLGESSVNIVVRAWVNSEDYWGVYFDMNEKVYKTFAEENLNIPFPQLDVHLHGKTE